VALVGRPNVGKSTLINRIAKTKDTITHAMPGVTRDRNYVDADWAGNYFTLIDTGGFEFRQGEPITEAMVDQAKMAIEEAEAVLFLVDGKEGLNPLDSEVAMFLRKAKKKVLLLVNKVDNIAKADVLISEFYQLGLGEPYPISASHGLGISEFLDKLIEIIPQRKPPADEDLINIAIVGKPNVGKSSILNSLTGQKRAIVSEVAGTTRDSLDSLVEYNRRTWRFIDTAGIKRKKVEDLEYYGLVRSLKALDRADIALLVIDASDKVTEQDQKIADMAASRGCAIIVMLNKWDLVDEAQIERLKDSVARRLSFINYAPLLDVSALEGSGLEDIFDHLEEVSSQYLKKLKTSQVNDFIAGLEVERFPSKGRSPVKLSYGSQVAARPPKFIFFVNNLKLITPSFRRFLERKLRQAFDFIGCPVWIGFKQK